MSEFPMNDEQETTATAELPTEAETPETSIGEAETEPASILATLTVKRSGVESAEVFEVHPPAVIGRFDASIGPIDVDLGGIPEGTYVSRKHAKITFEEGSWQIEDLGSSNGTFILRADFERIEKADLVDGDEIALGNARFVFRVC